MQRILTGYTLKIKKFISSNSHQILQILFLIILLLFFLLNGFDDIVKDFLEETVISPDNIVFYFIIAIGLFPVAVFFMALLFIRSKNADYVMNNILAYYHDYPYWWYFICAKILGIRKCSLVRVPIPKQFKLIINGTFDEFPLDERAFPEIENEADCKIRRDESVDVSEEINIIIEDTYQIFDSQIPLSKRSNPTILISRNDGTDMNRHYSPKLINATTNELRTCPDDIVVNVFATTNPINTLYIAKNAFALEGRGNIRHLYVYMQSGSGERAFAETGYKVY